jgi:lipopolysaccharide export system protein LptC
MQAPLWSMLSALLGALVGGAISYFLNRQQFAHQLRIQQEQHKVEYMAEETARHFLSHQGYTDRSFETLRRALGGFTDDELRKILVRAGAIRVYRQDGSEWWRLLSRMDEFIERKQLDQIAREI